MNPELAPELALQLAVYCPIALSLHAESGAFLASSPAFRELFGQATASPPDSTLLDHVAESDRELFQDAWIRALLAPQTVVVRYRLRSAESMWIESELRRYAPPGEAAGGPPESRLACASRRVTTAGPRTDALASSPPPTTQAGSAIATPVPGRAGQADSGDAGAFEDESAAMARKHRDYLVDMLPALVWHGPVAPDGKSYRLSQMNEYLFRVSGYSPQEWFRTPGFWAARIHPEDREATLAGAQKLLRDGGDLAPYRFRIADGSYLWLQSSMRIERSPTGQPLRMYGMTLDISRFKQAEEALAQLNRELAQKVEHILELSAPLLPVAEGSLVLPLIGTLDPGRTQHALGQLFDRVVALRARRVIIDLTGVAQADAQSVAALIRATQALRLLGAQPCLCGIRAEIALALRDHHQTLQTVTTHSTLQAALRASLSASAPA